jgi:hypothetical protein
MINEARKPQREPISEGDESKQLEAPPRAKALPLQLPVGSRGPRWASLPSPLLDELVRREYWTERAVQEGEVADAAEAAARGAIRGELPPGPSGPLRSHGADPSFDVGEDPWGLAG